MLRWQPKIIMHIDKQENMTHTLKKGNLKKDWAQDNAGVEIWNNYFRAAIIIMLKKLFGKSMGKYDPN